MYTIRAVLLGLDRKANRGRQEQLINVNPIRSNVLHQQLFKTDFKKIIVFIESEIK